MAASKNNHTLETLWKHMSTLSPTTPLGTLTEITTFFAPTGSFYLHGMTQGPSTSHASLITTLQTLQTYWKIVERKLVTHVEGEDGTIVNAMSNKLLILGKEVNGFAECEVVRFDEDARIKEYLLYCDAAAVKEAFAQKAVEEEE
ncbi:uncharacterized protein LY89DRAFT_691500 [Mollisia scopiformis]|uniref:SnoaL-like domain-containing protein n=1 Tax=Mollisia scopiformis TaxID=149040 RepID=A0A132B5V7_MOLSC|nr:uncharacterized protein LY89DRAFT_691500 [Mollisia scopiformis]KUJ07795.1 hypothetical protein LY89DRAFT_691500 [Mollisia scopiformis]